jgi:hypothetical protein
MSIGKEKLGGREAGERKVWQKGLAGNKGERLE